MEERQEDRSSPLTALQGKSLDGLTLRLELGPFGPVGARYFQVLLQDSQGRRSLQPALRGLHHSGSEPSYNWIEVFLFEREVSFPQGEGRPLETLDLSQVGLEEALLRALAQLIPPGGHLMVEYDSRPETAKALALGIPAVATPLGSLLFRVGCGLGLKDWYFPEGWREGPRKLQGFKALSEEHARRRARELGRELRDFLSREPDPRHREILAAARQRALEALEHLEREGIRPHRKDVHLPHSV